MSDINNNLSEKINSIKKFIDDSLIKDLAVIEFVNFGTFIGSALMPVTKDGSICDGIIFSKQWLAPEFLSIDCKNICEGILTESRLALSRLSGKRIASSNMRANPQKNSPSYAPANTIEQASYDPTMDYDEMLYGRCGAMAMRGLDDNDFEFY